MSTNSQISVVDLLGQPDTHKEAMNLIVEQYTERLYWHIRRILVCATDTEDVLQESFVTIFLNLDSFRGDNEISLRSWIYRIATTQALKELAKKRKWLFSSLDSVSGQLLSSLDSEISPSADEISVRLEKVQLSLPTKQRLVFMLRYYDELSFKEISEVTGDSVSTLKTNYHYAVSKIKEKINEIDIDDEKD